MDLIIAARQQSSGEQNSQHAYCGGIGATHNLHEPLHTLFQYWRSAQQNTRRRIAPETRVGTTLPPPARPSLESNVLLSLSSFCHERMFVVGRAPCYPQPPSETEDRMRELERAEINDRRVRLVAQIGDYYAVIIEVRGPTGWADISLRADQDLAFDVASRRYRLRVAEQQARALEWDSE
jgi:hypothetical protein